MQMEDHGAVRIAYPDRYASVGGGPPTGTVRRSGERVSGLPDNGVVEAAIDTVLAAAQMRQIDEFAFATQPGRRAVMAAGAAEGTISLEVDTLAGESAAVLVNTDGVYSWVFPSGLADARRSTRRTAIDQPSTLLFEIPVVGDARTERGGLFDIGATAVNWVKGKVLKISAGAAVGVAMKLLERNVEPGLVLIDSDDPDQWRRYSDFSEIELPEDRRARILLMVHGTFSSTVGSFRGLATSDWGKRLLADLNESYDAVVGFDHYTLSEAPDSNANDLLRRLEARSWTRAPKFDAISYSRGGLVLRSLVESLLPHSQLKTQHPEIGLGTGVFVGATNAGTILASPDNWHTLIDLHTNLAVGAARVLALMPGAPAVPILIGEALHGIADFAKYLATEAIDRNGIPGLAAMDPDGDFVRRINTTQPGQPSADEVAYHAVVSDFEPGRRTGGLVGELPKRLMLAVADKLTDQLMPESNDLVVNTRSMTSIDDPRDGFVREVLEFGRNGSVYHLVYFTQRKVDEAIRHWLGLREPRNVRATTGDPIPQFDAEVGALEAVPRRDLAPAPQRIRRPELNIEVVWGDICQEPGNIVAVGHYRGILPQAAEEAVDRAVSGQSRDSNDKSSLILTNMTKRNLIRGELGDIDFFPWGGDTDRMAAICGMGFQGTFAETSLRSLQRNLAWSVVSLPDERELNTVLIGAGTGNLDTRDAIRGLLAGFADALRSAHDRRIPILRIVERDKRKADEIHEILRDLGSESDAGEEAPIDITLMPKNRPRAGTGGVVDDSFCLDALLTGVARAGANAPYSEVKAQIAGNLPGRAVMIKRLDELAAHSESVPDLIKKLSDKRPKKDKTGRSDPTAMDRIGFYIDGGQMRVSAIAAMGSTVPERIVRIDPTLLEGAARRMTDPSKDVLPELASLLHGLVVPRDFRDYLRTRHNVALVLEVDRATAPVQWEILADRGIQEQTVRDETPASIGLSRPVARQLRTVYSPPPVWQSSRADHGLHALVIGDPGDPEKGHSLPGARDEAKVVARRLRDTGEFDQVHLLIGAPDANGRPSEPGFRAATRIDVLRMLINEPVDLVHYAGHGNYDLEDPSKTGWLFKDGMMTAGEVSRVDRIPPLVIANACLTSQLTRSRSDGRKEQYDAALLPSLADEFFKRGVLNYIGTAWQVDDRGAVQFAKTFYAEFLSGAQLGMALLKARTVLSERADALWAAYQHYGDPSFSINDF